MIDIEIILVNDKSKDDSLKIIKNIQKYDKRIKISLHSLIKKKLINNQKNMGSLYSRSIGVLFPLDNDDMFFDDDVFNFIYEEANNFNYDIVGFKAIQANSYKARINKLKMVVICIKKISQFISQI